MEESPPPQPVSDAGDHTHLELRNLRSPTSLPEANIYRNIEPACDHHDNGKRQILIVHRSIFDLELNPHCHCFFQLLLSLQRDTMMFYLLGQV